MKSICIQFCAICVIVAAVALFGSAPTFCQDDRSKDRDKPTPITAKELIDDLDGSDDEYYYQFKVGPGELTVTIEVKANETNAGAYLDLFGPKSKALLSNVLVQGVDKGSERVVKTVKFTKGQDLVLRITGIKYGSSGGTGTYKIRLDGPVIIKNPPEPK